VLEVSHRGDQGFLVFRCRIGHTYSADELIRGKEERLEYFLWASITARDELSALLEDLASWMPDPERRARLLERAERAREHIRALRARLEADEPVLPGTGCHP
jgi:hypothetical protein